MDIYEIVAEAKKQGRSLILATVVQIKGSVPRETGAKLIIWPDGKTDGTIGGGAVENAVIEEAKEMFKTNRSKLLDYDLSELNMQCGGRMSIYIEPVIPNPPLFIFGAGHIGVALAHLAHGLNFSVSVIDNRPDFANRQRFPHAQNIIAENYSKAFEELKFNDNTYVVILTHKHLFDQEVVEHCVQKSFKYLGMIGSRTKVKKSLDQLADDGIPEKQLKRIHSPIGLNIAAQTPEEIAVAIAAELIGVRNGADLNELTMKLHHD